MRDIAWRGKGLSVCGGADRLLYIDTDVYVVDDVGKLLDLPMGDAVFAAAPEDTKESSRGPESRYPRLGLSDAHSFYFNSGVMVFNMPAYRAAGGSQRIVEILMEYGTRIRAPDQDALNILAQGKVAALHPRWNYNDGWCERQFRLSLRTGRLYHGRKPYEMLEAMVNPGIIHYKGGQKPVCANHRTERRRYEAAMRRIGYLHTRFLPGTTTAGFLAIRLFDAYHAHLLWIARLRLTVWQRRRPLCAISDRTAVRVSIVIPVYNAEPYLEQCLESVLGQTVRDIEVICVDDGSTDGSAAVLSRYARRDGRLRVRTQPTNQGQAAARNRALAEATGDYIMFVDADDALAPNAVEVFLDVARQSGAAVVVSERFASLEADDATGRIPAPPRRYRLHAPPLPDFVRDRRIFSGVWNKLYRADVLAGRRFAEGMVFEDWPFLLTLFADIASYATFRCDLYRYRRTANSTVRSAFTRFKVESYLRGIRETGRHFAGRADGSAARRRIAVAAAMLVNKVSHAHDAALSELAVQGLDAAVAKGDFCLRDMPLKSRFRLWRLRRGKGGGAFFWGILSVALAVLAVGGWSWGMRRVERAPTGSVRQVYDLGTNAVPRQILTPDIANLRDIGGWRTMDGRRVRYGCLYRSAEFNRKLKWGMLPCERFIRDDTRRYLVETLGIRTDLDLREPKRLRGVAGSPLGAGVRLVNISSERYECVDTAEGGAALVAGLRVLTEEENLPVVVHCQQGKDRAGTFVAVVEGLLGVAEEDVRRDWELSAKWMPSHRKKAAAFDDFMRIVKKEPGETLRDRMEAFVGRHGFSTAEVARLRELLCESDR